jgi:hypothetical protein
VNIGPNRCSALAALAIAVALSGCANLDGDSSGLLFAKPMDWFGRNGGYTYSDLQEAKQQRPITANDLVQENGACAAPPALPQSQSPSNNPGAPPAAAPDTNSLLGGGIALGMSECEVVYRAGQPGRVALGRNPNGDRTAVLTYSSGPRPGVYRFERGRLMEMDRVAESPPPLTPQQAKKKKPAGSAKPQKKNDQA